MEELFEDSICERIESGNSGTKEGGDGGTVVGGVVSPLVEESVTSLFVVFVLSLEFVELPPDDEDVVPDVVLVRLLAPVVPRSPGGRLGLFMSIGGGGIMPVLRTLRMRRMSFFPSGAGG